MAERVPCPFVYASGKSCTGHVVRVEAYKANLTWEQAEDGLWSWDHYTDRHYHLFCSEKSNHAGHKRADSDQMKCRWNELPELLLAAMLDAKGKP